MAFLLDDILLAPLKFVAWTARKVHEAAQQQTSDESKVREDLLALQMRRELGEIRDEDLAREEARLVQELEEIRKSKEKPA